MFSFRSERVECSSCYCGVGYYSQSHLWVGLAVRLHRTIWFTKTGLSQFYSFTKNFSEQVAWVDLTFEYGYSMTAYKLLVIIPYWLRSCYSPYKHICLAPDAPSGLLVRFWFQGNFNHQLSRPPNLPSAAQITFRGLNNLIINCSTQSVAQPIGFVVSHYQQCEPAPTYHQLKVWGCEQLAVCNG